MQSPFESLKKIALSGKKILLLSQENPSLDMAASLLALAGFLKKNGGTVSVLLPKESLHQLFFLEKNFPLISQINHARDFVLIFNTEKNQISNVRTEKKEKEYLIRISPEKGTIDPKDFSFIPADFNYDWLLLAGVTSLEKIGTPYFENPDLFFELPKINIDNQSENEAYGQINLLDNAASCIGEIITDLFLEKQPEILDQEIAKALLTALIAGTDSFQNPTTSPQAMVLAARLMKFGVSQAEIIRHLYRSKNLPFLKLWGKTMARLEWEKDISTVYSWVDQENFLSSQATSSDLGSILEEIQKNFSSAKICILFYINEKKETCGEIALFCHQKTEKICALFNQPPREKLSLNFGQQDLVLIKKEVLEKIRQASGE